MNYGSPFPIALYANKRKLKILDCILWLCCCTIGFKTIFWPSDGKEGPSRWHGGHYM